MANNCLYVMKVVGKKENCEKWLKKMNDYEEENHFFRIFSTEICDEGEDFIEISGDCAWSIETCCRAGGYSQGTDLLEINSRDLDLVVEIYSQECGMAFEEHYLYKKGECIVDECTDWFETYNEETYEFSESGGFENYGEWVV